MFKKGLFIISLDTELAWGTFDQNPEMPYMNYFQNTRYCIDRLLDLLYQYNISSTFAIVGHLMLSECHLEDGIKHKNIIRPDFRWYKKDWFSDDPINSCGLLNIPGNMLYLSRSGIRRLIPVSCSVKKARKGLDRAIKNKEFFICGFIHEIWLQILKGFLMALRRY